MPPHPPKTIKIDCKFPNNSFDSRQGWSDLYEKFHSPSYKVTQKRNKTQLWNSLKNKSGIKQPPPQALESLKCNLIFRWLFEIYSLRLRYSCSFCSVMFRVKGFLLSSRTLVSINDSPTAISRVYANTPLN